MRLPWIILWAGALSWGSGTEAAQAGANSGAAVPAASSTYRNPLLPEVQMADPHVIRVNGKYYLYATTHTRGYDVYVSDDLVNWENKGRVFSDPRGGAWAPDVFHHRRGDGKFYLYYTDNMPGVPRTGGNKQIGVAVSDSPLGPFEDKVVLVTNSIDAHLFADEDGALYFYWVHLAGGFKIMGQAMADPLTPKGEAKLLIRPTEEWEMRSGHVTEGPFMLKRNGTYYLMYSGTGADSPNYALATPQPNIPWGPSMKIQAIPLRTGAARCWDLVITP
jgi:beta-xylosidase